MKEISETTFLYWLYDQIEIIKNQKNFKNKISNMKQAKSIIDEIKGKLVHIPEPYRIHFKQELKDIKVNLKQNPQYTYIFLSALNILICNIINNDIK